MRTTTERWTLAISVALFLLAIAVGAELARPFGAASIAFDTQVSALHFARIVDGEHLERFVTTTPKPLMTLVAGLPYALTGDWRPIAWATILAFALGVSLCGWLAGRLAGPVAAAFAGLAVLAGPEMLTDVGLALATPWALVGWAGAGVAVASRSHPRYGLAGAALLFATLARVETLVIVGVVVVVLVGAAIARRPAPRRAWLVPAIALLALPVMALHDWLLTGDPLMWTQPSAVYSQNAGDNVLSPWEVVVLLLGHYAVQAAMVLLALVGVVRLALARRWAIVVGLVALGPGIAAFLVLLAVRGVFVTGRYAAPIDVAVAVASGVGFAVLWLRAIRRLARTSGSDWLDRHNRVVRVAAAVVVAVALAWPLGPLDLDLRRAIRSSVTAAAEADRAIPALREAIAADPAGISEILVPTSVLPRLALALDRPLTSMVGTDSVSREGLEGLLAPGQLVLHIPRAERQSDLMEPLQTTVPTTIGPVTVTPLWTDGSGAWLVSTE